MDQKGITIHRTDEGEALEDAKAHPRPLKVDNGWSLTKSSAPSSSIIPYVEGLRGQRTVHLNNTSEDAKVRDGRFSVGLAVPVVTKKHHVREYIKRASSVLDQPKRNSGPIIFNMDNTNVQKCGGHNDTSDACRKNLLVGQTLLFNSTANMDAPQAN
jgi:hypothetical protein